MCNKFGTLLDLEGCNKGSFEAHASYLRDAFDGVTKVIQLVEAKLGLGCLSTGREDAEASTLEEYATVLAIRVVRNKWCIVEIVLVGDRGPGSRQWCTNSSERRVFVCASKLALDESLSHQHMEAVYHRGRSPSASTRESHGGGRDNVNNPELLGAPLR
ncbi:hypothetical protein BHM03_00022988 [Ensete ventricosum]|nr:hypothetical protein BHM03_00022988 [Ensete ventricosum]